MSAPMDFLEKFARAQDHAHDAASAAEDACYEIGKIAEELESLVKDRDALRAVLREVMNIERSSSKSMNHDSILCMPASILERIEKLLEGAK